MLPQQTPTISARALSPPKSKNGVADNVGDAVRVDATLAKEKQSGDVQVTKGESAVGDAAPTGFEGDADHNKLRSACDNCSLKKIKCDGEPTCQACRKRSVRCHYSIKRPTGPKRAALAAAAAAAAVAAAAAAAATSSSSTPSSKSSSSSSPSSSSSSSSPSSNESTNGNGKGNVNGVSTDVVSCPRAGGKRLRGLTSGAVGCFGSGAGAGTANGAGVTAADGGKAAAAAASAAASAAKDGVKPAVTLSPRGGLASREAAGIGSRTGRTRATAAVAAGAATDTPSPTKTTSGGTIASTTAALRNSSTGSGEGAAANGVGDLGPCSGSRRHDGEAKQSHTAEAGLPAKAKPEEWSEWQSAEDTAAGTGGSPGARRNHSGGAQGRRGGGGGSTGGGVGGRKEAERVAAGNQRAHEKPPSSDARAPSTNRGGKRLGSGGRASSKRGGGDAGGPDSPGRRKGERGGVGVAGRGCGTARRTAAAADSRARSGHTQPAGSQGQVSAQAAADSTRALGDRERHLLDVFLSFARAALINAALSVGALVTRDRRAAGVFAERARQHLKEIFDAPSEEAASAFLCLAYFNTYSGEGLRADLYLVQAHSFCLNLNDFPLNLEICIEHLSHGRLKIDLRPDFHSWNNRRYQVLHVANHVLSTLTQQGDRGLPAALQTNDPSRFEGGEDALLRCVQELVTCIRISERDTLARLICSSFVGLLLMLLGRREESIAVAESVVEGVTPTPAIIRVMPLSWTATIITSALLFIYDRRGVYARLYELVAPAQKLPGSAGQSGGECPLPVPGSDIGVYLRHSCGVSTFCRMVVTVARLTDRGTKNFCPARSSSQTQDEYLQGTLVSALFSGGEEVSGCKHGDVSMANALRGDRTSAPLQGVGRGRGVAGAERVAGARRRDNAGGAPTGEGDGGAERDCEEDPGTQSLAGLLRSPSLSPMSQRRPTMFETGGYDDLQPRPKTWPGGAAARDGRGGNGGAADCGHVQRLGTLQFMNQHREQQHHHHHQSHHVPPPQPEGSGQGTACTGGSGPTDFQELSQQRQRQRHQQYRHDAHLSGTHRGPPLFPPEFPHEDNLMLEDFNPSISPGSPGVGGFGQSETSAHPPRVDDGAQGQHQQQEQHQQRQQQQQHNQQERQSEPQHLWQPGWEDFHPPMLPPPEYYVALEGRGGGVADPPVPQVQQQAPEPPPPQTPAEASPPPPQTPQTPQTPAVSGGGCHHPAAGGGIPRGVLTNHGAHRSLGGAQPSRSSSMRPPPVPVSMSMSVPSLPPSPRHCGISSVITSGISSSISGSSIAIHSSGGGGGGGGRELVQRMAAGQGLGQGHHFHNGEDCGFDAYGSDLLGSHSFDSGELMNLIAPEGLT